MAKQALAVKYRPKRLEDVCEQKSVIQILRYMIEEKCFPNCFLFCGSAGCGKTTTARIVANMINNGKGIPIEIDAASNSSVDDVRKIVEESKLRALDAEYKVYIIDECHVISATGWQAFLKLIEEPPAKTIYVFCTTDPQKIPNTILSRIQRFDFNKITYETIVSRLKHIIKCEQVEVNDLTYTDDAVSFIAKTSGGGMRDAITMLDKCIGYSHNVNMNTVVSALGVQDYTTYFKLLDSILYNQPDKVIRIIEEVYFQGGDLKLFVKNFITFLLDLSKYNLLHDYKYIQIPNTFDNQLKSIDRNDYGKLYDIRNTLIQLNADIKWESAPKTLIEATMLQVCYESNRSN